MNRHVIAVVAFGLLSGTGVVAAAAVGAPSPGSPGLGDPYFPLAGNGGYDVAHYNLTVDYDPGSDELEGVARIRAEATQTLSSYNLDLDGLEVRSVTVDGTNAEWTRKGGELTVTPARPLRAGRDFVTVVSYDGVPVQLRHGPGVIPTDDGALILGEPAGASTWFPVNDHPLDKASYTVAVTVPQGLEAIGNGALQGVSTEDGASTWTWHAQEPMAPYLATASIGEFEVDAYRTGGLRYWDAIDPDLFEQPAPDPRTGAGYAWSQQTGDGASYKRLARVMTVPAGGADLSFWVDRGTEADWDYFFVEAREAGTRDWTTLPDENGHTTRDTGVSCPAGWQADHPFLRHYQTDNGDGTCSPTGTTGEWWAISGTSDGYEPWQIDLSDYAGGRVHVSLTYVSDSFLQKQGVFVDDVAVSTNHGTTSFEDDGDALDGWLPSGPPRGSASNENNWTATPAVELEPLGVAIRASLKRQPEIIRFLESRFGRYPFSTAGGVVDDEDTGFALETQTRPVYSPGFWEFGSGDDVVVHEIAHQWYGDHVAVARWRNIWLNEGFATYAEWLWRAEEGIETEQEAFDFFYNEIPLNDPFWSLRIGNPGPNHLFDGPVYVRGAMTLHALRSKIGDDAFFRVLRTWASDEGNGTTGQFIRLAEQVSGRQLDPLFRAWLFTSGRPDRAAGPSARSTGEMSAAAKSLLAATRRR